MTITNNTIINNNISNLGGGSSGSAFANFDVYQQTPVELSELSLSTNVPDNISTDPYRKVLIVRIFFHQICSLTYPPFVSFNDLLATVAAYFNIITGSAEKATEGVAQSVSLFCFRVSNIIGVTFSDSFGKPIKVPDTDNRPRTSRILLFCAFLYRNFFFNFSFIYSVHYIATFFHLIIILNLYLDLTLYPYLTRQLILHHRMMLHHQILLHRQIIFHRPIMLHRPLMFHRPIMLHRQISVILCSTMKLCYTVRLCSTVRLY